MPRRVVSEFAESYSRLVMSTRALGNLVDWPEREDLRLAGAAPLVADANMRNMLLPHLVAIAEDFSRQTLLQCSLPHVPVTHPLLEDIWRRVERQAEGSWDEHASSWRKWHSLSLRDGPDYISLRAFVECRNAVMHGLGRLTRRQLGDDGGQRVIKDLSGVGILVVGRKVIVDEEAVDHCAETARSFVNWLDLAVQEAGLERSP